VDDVAMDPVCITIDCSDPAAVATFWNEALRWSGVEVTDGGAIAICGPADGGLYLEFVRVPEPKTTKNRLHLGCSAPTLDQLDAEIARLEALGASVAWEEEFPPEIAATYRNVILRDVEGNEFCLGAGTPPPNP
jgi:predicted enzyme related to lactoylglutathione lyase